jgi:hypothetical protein
MEFVCRVERQDIVDFCESNFHLASHSLATARLAIQVKETEKSDLERCFQLFQDQGCDVKFKV